MKPEGEEDAQRVRLLDGSEVSVRRLGVRDIDAVTGLHEKLTDQERYLRFFVVHPSYLETFARKLVQRDRDHVAIGAFDSDRLIGAANYVMSRDPGVAEVAVAVAHADHERGVATALLQRLGRIARSNGIHEFVAEVLTENLAMRKVISDAGWRHKTQSDGSVLSIRIDLADAEKAPSPA